MAARSRDTLTIEPAKPARMENRLAHLENEVRFLRRDVDEVRVDVREVKQKVTGLEIALGRLDVTVVRLDERIDSSSAAVIEKLNALGKSFAHYPTKLQLSLMLGGALTACLAGCFAFVAFLMRQGGHPLAADAMDALLGK